MTPQKSTKSVFRLLAVLLFAGAALAGCLSGEAEAASGELYVKDRLTDEASAVYITFNKAEVLPAQGQGWQTVFEGEETFEMLSLSGPNDKAKLSEFELSPGEYLHLRITITNVTVVDHEGNETHYPTFGNVVTIGHDITVRAGGDFEVLVDFDLENGVDLANQEYVPVIGYAQTTHKGRDGAGNETNRTDRPEQSNAMDHRGIHGVCTAWANAEQGRSHGNATNSTAFTWLQNQSAEANQTVDDYCAEQSRPGASGSLMDILPEQMPEQARSALQDRQLGPMQDGRPAGAGDGAGPGGAARNETGPQGGGGQGAGGQGNQTQSPGPSGNQTGQGQGPPN